MNDYNKSLQCWYAGCETPPDIKIGFTAPFSVPGARNYQFVACKAHGEVPVMIAVERNAPYYIMPA